MNATSYSHSSPPRSARTAGSRGSAHHKRVARIEQLAKAMDSQFRIPATNIRFGLDALAGLVPGIGDAVSSAASAFIIFDAWRLGLPGRKLAAMAGNIVFDFVIGAVPLLGDILDVGWKANLRNAKLVREHLENSAGRKPDRSRKT